jgi:5-(carboxyamino)imidazole ribonucleotide mutase
MGSDSDLMVMQEAAALLDEFNVSYNLTIVSAHRTPERMIEFAKAAANNGTKVIIAGAGGAAHLPGMVAACTHLPVIGVPIQSKAMSGIDSLYSIVQMPQGVPVATVAINGAHNAALLALQILALLADNNITEQLINYKRKLKEMVENKANEIEQLGYKSFLEKS